VVLVLLAVSLMGGSCDAQVFAPAGISAVNTVINALANTIGVFAAQTAANVLLPFFEGGVDAGAISSVG